LRRAPHPVVWTILYLPFGAMSGFVSVALTFQASQHGLSISEGALLNGAQLLSQWLKWMWAPLVDATLSPRRWYVISTGLSAVGVLAMSILPLGPHTLGALLAIIAVASLVNSVVGMSVEALMASSTTPEQIGRVSAWFQVGNLGGAGAGGGLGLWLFQKLPSAWMTGAIVGGLFVLCCAALRFTAGGPSPSHGNAHAPGPGAPVGVRQVIRDLGAMLKSRGGRLAVILCALPVGTGAAQGILTQAKVAAAWGAGAEHVALVQGFLTAVVTAVGCFAGGALCRRLHPRSAYAAIGLGLAAIAVVMGAGPASVPAYVAGSLIYAFGVGLAFAAFTALVLDAMGPGSAATKYNVFASLSNFPIWWLGLLLGVVAEKRGPRRMLFTEAALGVAGVALFALAARLARPHPAAPPA